MPQTYRWKEIETDTSYLKTPSFCVGNYEHSMTNSLFLDRYAMFHCHKTIYSPGKTHLNMERYLLRNWQELRWVRLIRRIDKIFQFKFYIRCALETHKFGELNLKRVWEVPWFLIIFELWNNRYLLYVTIKTKIQRGKNWITLYGGCKWTKCM